MHVRPPEVRQHLPVRTRYSGFRCLYGLCEMVEAVSRFGHFGLIKRMIAKIRDSMVILGRVSVCRKTALGCTSRESADLTAEASKEGYIRFIWAQA